MYQGPIRAGGAGQHYRSVDVRSKVEGASPHRLVAILYEELLAACAACRQAVRRGDAHRRTEATAQALSLVQALDQSLDFDKGGEIARALTAVYGEARRLITLGAQANDADAIGRAQAMIGEIAQAWTAIG